VTRGGFGGAATSAQLPVRSVNASLDAAGGAKTSDSRRRDSALDRSDHRALYFFRESFERASSRTRPTSREDDAQLVYALHTHTHTHTFNGLFSGTPPLSFFTGPMPFLPPNQQRQTQGPYRPTNPSRAVKPPIASKVFAARWRTARVNSCPILPNESQRSSFAVIG